MIKKKSRAGIRQKKHERIRFHLSGTPSKPRMAVFRSNKHMYVQIIDDEAGNTLVSASTLDKDIAASLKNTDDTEAAKALGSAVAKRAMDKGIETVVFDRAGFLYAGKIKALADSAREAGLKF